jgi:Uri superfamily endonuclease
MDDLPIQSIMSALILDEAAAAPERSQHQYFLFHLTNFLCTSIDDRFDKPYPGCYNPPAARKLEAFFILMEADDIRLPASGGSYALFLRLPQPRRLRVGRLGDRAFPAGTYVYLGSAYGPGGLQARIGRHLRGDGNQHWHVDTLRKPAAVRGYAYFRKQRAEPHPEWKAPLECLWSRALAALPEATIPVLGFGASDCRAGCPAHLIAFPDTEAWPLQKKRIVAALANALGVPKNEVRIYTVEGQGRGS